MKIRVSLKNDGTSKVEYPAENGLRVAVEVTKFTGFTAIDVNAEYPRVAICDQGIALLKSMVELMGQSMTMLNDTAWYEDAKRYLDSRTGDGATRLRQEA